MSPATVGTSTCAAVRDAASTTWATSRLAEPPEADAEVERRADHDDQVGALLEQRRRVRRNASGWSAGSMPRPRPLKKHGTPSASAAPTRARSTRRPSRRRCPPGTPAARRRRSTAASSRDRVRVGGGRAVQPMPVGHLAGRRTEHVEREVEEHGPAVRLGGEPGGGVHLLAGGGGVGRPSPTSFVIGARIGGWSSSCNEPAPHRRAGARPPSTTTGDPLKCADVTAETPLVTPGPAVSAASPGLRVSLAYASAANVADPLVAGVDDPHRLRSSGRLVERPDVATVEREHHVDCRTARAPRSSGARRDPRHEPSGHSRTQGAVELMRVKYADHAGRWAAKLTARVERRRCSRRLTAGMLGTIDEVSSNRWDAAVKRAAAQPGNIRPGEDQGPHRLVRAGGRRRRRGGGRRRRVARLRHRRRRCSPPPPSWPGSPPAPAT